MWVHCKRKTLHPLVDTSGNLRSQTKFGLTGFNELHWRENRWFGSIFRFFSVNVKYFSCVLHRTGSTSSPALFKVNIYISDNNLHQILCKIFHCCKRRGWKTEAELHHRWPAFESRQMKKSGTGLCFLELHFYFLNALMLEQIFNFPFGHTFDCGDATHSIICYLGKF